MDAAVRRNFILGVTHEGVWGAAFGLVNPFTILPLAAHALGRSVADAGLMEAALFAGINAPQLLAAFAIGPRFSEPKACAWLHAICIAGTGIAGMGLAWPGLSPDLRWAIFLGAFILHWVGMGIAVPSWAALSSRNIPDALLGRYFGLSFASGGAAGAVTGVLGAWLVAQGGLDWGYASCCALAFFFQILSVVLLARTRPIGRAHPEPGRLLPYLQACWQHLRSDRGFQAMIVLVFCMLLAGSSTQLFTASLKEKGLPDASFQWLNPALSIGGMLGSYWLGHLFDHQGAWRPWMISMGLLLASLAGLVWGGGNLGALTLVYLGAGLYNAVHGSVNLPWIVRRFGTAQTPIFMGLFNSLLAPWWFLAPYSLGRLARSYGTDRAFAVSALATLACIGVLLASPSLRQKAPA